MNSISDILHSIAHRKKLKKQALEAYQAQRDRLDSEIERLRRCLPPGAITGREGRPKAMKFSRGYGAIRVV